jgi:hypothetical protein
MKRLHGRVFEFFLVTSSGGFSMLSDMRCWSALKLRLAAVDEELDAVM